MNLHYNLKNLIISVVITGTLYLISGCTPSKYHDLVALVPTYFSENEYNQSAYEINALDALSELDRWQRLLGEVEESQAKENIKKKISKQYHALGIAVSNLGHHHMALHYYRLALKYDPDNTYIYNSTAVDSLALEKTESGLTNIRKYMEEEPNNTWAKRLEGDLQFVAGQYQDAEKTYKKVIEDAPGTEIAGYAALVLHMINTLNGEENTSFIEENLDFDVWPSPIYLLMVGKLEASEIIRDHLTDDPEMGRLKLVEILYYLGELENLTGDTELARELFEATIQLNVPSFKEFSLAKISIRKL